MTTPSSSNRQETPTPDIRAAMGRGGMRPGRIEKAGNPRRALVRLVLYLRPYTYTLLVVLLFVLGYILLGLLEPYLIGRAIDNFISVKQISGLMKASLFLLTVYIFDNVFQAASSWLMAGISQDALRRLRRDLFEHLQKLSIHFFDSHTAGRADEPPDERYRSHQPGCFPERGVAGRQRAVAGRHRDRHVHSESLAGAGSAARRPDHVLVHTVRRPLHPQRLSQSAKGTG